MVSIASQIMQFLGSLICYQRKSQYGDVLASPHSWCNQMYHGPEVECDSQYCVNIVSDQVVENKIKFGNSPPRIG